MHQKPTNYDEVIAKPWKLEEIADINGVEYGISDLIVVKTKGDLFGREAPAVGNCIAREFTLQMLPPGVDVPLESPVNLYVQLRAGDMVTGRIPKGKFFVDLRERERTGSGNDVYLYLHGYDALMKAQEEFPESFTFPKTDREVVQFVCDTIGCDNGTDFQNGYSIGQPTDYTMQDTLGYIAAMYGGNMAINESGSLVFVPLQKDDGTPIMPSRLKNGDPVQGISKVIVHRMDGVSFTAESSLMEGETHRVLDVDTPWATQAVADYVFSVVTGYEYHPFTATDVILSPLVELGDTVTVYDVTENVYKQNVSFGAMAMSLLEAPPVAEQDRNYYPNKNRVSRSAGSASRKIERVKYDHAELKAKVDDASTGLDAKVQYSELENGEWVEANTAIFASAEGKRSAIDVWVSGESGGTISSGIDLIADVTTIHGNLDIKEGRLHSEKSIISDLSIIGRDINANGGTGHGIVSGRRGAFTELAINGHEYEEKEIQFMEPGGSGGTFFFDFAGGTKRGLTQYSGRTGRSLAFAPNSATNVEFITKGGEKVTSCWVGSLPLLTVTSPDGTVGQYAMDSGYWEIQSGGTPTSKWFLVKKQTTAVQNFAFEGMEDYE